MKHLEPNKKVNDMRKNKPISLVFISLLVLSTLIIVYTPTVRSGSFTEPTNQYFYGTLSPQVVSEGYEGKSVKFQFSLTSNTTAAHNITKVVVTAPTGWTITAAECNDTWTTSIASPPASVTFTNQTGSAMLSNGTLLLFNITANVKVGTGTWDITCSEKETEPPTSLGSVTKSVLVTPYFKAEISPSVVKSGDTYTFALKVTHNTTLSSIYMVNITYPTTGGWSYDDLVSMPEYWVIDSHDTANGIIVLRGTGGHFIAPGQSATFSFNMTLGTGASNGTWSVTCINTAMQNATATLTVAVDDTAPTVSITSPSAGRVSGAVWINATITEAHLKEWVIKINGTQVTTGTTTTVSYQWNTTSYADASYVINVTATDVVGNIGFDDVTVEVDNTAPQLIEIVLGAFTGGTWSGNYTPIGDVFWVPGTVTGIKINATFSDAGTLSGYVYFNVTAEVFTNNSWVPSAPYSISGVNSIPVKINITDDQGNRYVHTWTVSKDFNAPTTPTYTEYEAICGGMIIKGINSSDAESGISHYKIYINGTAEQITPAQLSSATWFASGGNLSSFSGVLVVNLTAYGGSIVNITITSVDNANMESNGTTIIKTIPVGKWHAIQLHKGWNLISLPLVPANSSIASVLSLLLKQGVLGSVWHYDAETKMWHSYAPGAPPDLITMVDGKGYFINVTAYNVLIVQGTEQPLPPATPPVYHVVPGWNLIGYKEIVSENVSTYLSGVDYIRVYSFDASTQTYTVLRPSDDMTPGLGYWVAVKTEGWIYP
jgi:hypothetical protein